MATTSEAVRAPRRTDFMPLDGIDHVELWVGNAAQASYYFRHAFGFRELAYSGLETGLRDRTSRVLQQGHIRLVLTGTLRSGTGIARHHALHGDGVKVIALSVPDVDQAYHEATKRGAPGIRAPHTIEDSRGRVASGVDRAVSGHVELSAAPRASRARPCGGGRRRPDALPDGEEARGDDLRNRVNRGEARARARSRRG